MVSEFDMAVELVEGYLRRGIPRNRTCIRELREAGVQIHLITYLSRGLAAELPGPAWPFVSWLAAQDNRLG